MAEMKCNDGTVIKISNETEAELRQAFGPKSPKYEDGDIVIDVNNNKGWPISISTDNNKNETVARDVEDTEALIVALQEAVKYCKQHHLGL